MAGERRGRAGAQRRSALRPRFRLRFPASAVLDWAGRYPATGSSETASDKIRAAVRARGHLTRTEFLTICAWKSPRSQPRCKENSEHEVRTITGAALATADEVLKIDLLRMLRGVEWPTASTILHLCDALPYPILDYRALWSLGYAKPPAYTMEFWLAYLEHMRRLSIGLGLSIRTVDRALWQYSKEKQG